MRTFIFTLAAFTVFGISSCKKEQTDPSSSIMGKWRWVKSVGGIAGQTLTPQSTGMNFRNEYYPDSTFKRYQNDSLLVDGHFSIIKGGYNSIDMGKIDILKDGLISHSLFIRNDTLYMYDLFISDGFSDVYVRIK